MFGANRYDKVQFENIEREILEQWLRRYLLLLLCTMVFLLYSMLYLTEALKSEIPLTFVRRRSRRRSRC
jgi:hypothetical protein